MDTPAFLLDFRTHHLHRNDHSSLDYFDGSSSAHCRDFKTPFAFGEKSAYMESCRLFVDSPHVLHAGHFLVGRFLGTRSDDHRLPHGPLYSLALGAMAYPSFIPALFYDRLYADPCLGWE